MTKDEFYYSARFIKSYSTGLVYVAVQLATEICLLGIQESATSCSAVCYAINHNLIQFYVQE